MAALALATSIAGPPPATAQRVYCDDDEVTAGGERIGSVRVYMTPDEGRRAVFPGAVGFERQIFPVPASPDQQAEDRPVTGDSLEVHLVHDDDDDDDLLGYAVVTEKIGKYWPITFLVGITPTFRVAGVAVLVYRESRGSEVRRTRFLR